MKARAHDILATTAGLIMVVASAAAGVAIRLLLTAPASVTTVMDGHVGGPIYAVVRALYEAVSRMVPTF